MPRRRNEVETEGAAQPPVHDSGPVEGAPGEPGGSSGDSSRERGHRREYRGVVVSNAMDKTVVVRVDTVKVHPRYKKVIRRSKRYHAHDERNEASVGDVVRIVESRPISKSKSFRLVEVVEAAK